MNLLTRVVKRRKRRKRSQATPEKDETPERITAQSELELPAPSRELDLGPSPADLPSTDLPSEPPSLTTGPSSPPLEVVQETQLSLLLGAQAAVAARKQPVPRYVEIADSQSSMSSLPDPIDYRYLVDPKDAERDAKVVTTHGLPINLFDSRPSPVLGEYSDPVSEVFPSKSGGKVPTAVEPKLQLSREYDSSIHFDRSQTSQLPTPAPESTRSETEEVCASPPRRPRDPYELDFSTPRRPTPSSRRSTARKIQPPGSGSGQAGSSAKGQEKKEVMTPSVAASKTPVTICSEVKGLPVVSEEELASIFSDGEIDFDEFLEPTPRKDSFPPVQMTPGLPLDKTKKILTFKTPRRNDEEYLSDDNSLVGLMSTPSKDYGRETPFIKTTPRAGLISRKPEMTKKPKIITYTRKSTRANSRGKVVGVLKTSTSPDATWLDEFNRTPVRGSDAENEEPSPELPPLPRPVPNLKADVHGMSTTTPGPQSRSVEETPAPVVNAAAATPEPLRQTKPAVTTRRSLEGLPPSTGGDSSKKPTSSRSGPISCTPVPVPKPWLAAQRAQNTTPTTKTTTTAGAAVSPSSTTMPPPARIRSAAPSKTIPAAASKGGPIKQTPVPLPPYIRALARSG